MAFSEQTIQRAQVSAEMYEGYRKLLEGCRSAGVELFLAYHLCGLSNPASTFGLLEWIDQPLEQSVKYRAMLQEWVDD